VWQKELTRSEKQGKRYWRLVVTSEWIAGIAMLVGFSLLAIFAVVNSSAVAEYPVHIGPD
jgi:hypothetical protein